MIFAAIYDFVASNSEEVSINSGDFMTVIDASDPDWSLVSVFSNFEAQTGLVPKTYIAPAQLKYSVVALYDYAPQNEDEVGITQGEQFDVYVDDDADWFWGTNTKNVGLAPKNYFSTDSPSCGMGGTGDDADAHSQKNKLLNALDGFGFAATGPKKEPSEPKLELISYLVTDMDKKKKKKGFLGVGEDYVVSFVDEKSKKSLYQYHLRDVTFSEKKSKRFIVNITQNGGLETKEYEGDKSDIQGLLAQFTQCQALYQKTLGSPKQKTVQLDVPAQVPNLQTVKVELPKLQQSAPKIVVALYDYTAADYQELSIVENENLLVLDDNDPDWWMVRSMKKGGKEGFVPKTYVQYKQKLGDVADNSLLSHQTSAFSQLDTEQSEIDQILEREEAEAREKEEAERIRNWKALEEQRIRWEKERIEQEAEEEKSRQLFEEQNRLRIEQESGQLPKSSSLRGSVTSQPSVVPPPIASRPEIAPPPIASRPDIAPPPIASRPDIAPPSIASRPDIAPPSIASRPDIAPPPVASRPDIAPPPIASRPDIAPPPVASRPVIAPPSIASRPEIALPSIASRPDIAPPPIASRPEILPLPIASRPSVTGRLGFVPPVSARTEVIPAIPLRPSTEALGTAYKNETSASSISIVSYSEIIEPESEIREWKDKTGTFKINAFFLSVIDNKVHLRKADSGGKISIQLEKLHSNDIEYIRSIPGYEKVATAGPLAKNFPPLQTRKTSQVDERILAQAAAIQLSEPARSSFVYNGFDWKTWLMKAGVSPGDSITYGQKFCVEKLDSSSISSLDRELLRALGVSEGDIIRIKRAVVDTISGEDASSAARELEAQNRNLDKIRIVSSARSSFVGSDGKSEDLGSQKQQQIESDEAFARRLQSEEIQPQGPKAQKSFSRNAVDLNAIKDASAILEASNSSTKNAPSVLKKSVTVNKSPTAFSTLPSTEDAISNSLGIKDKDSSSKHNPWSIPGQESRVPQATAPVQKISIPVNMPARSSPPVVPVRPAPQNPVVPPGAPETLTKTQMQQKEAQLALQRAQYDLKLAQEQAKQAAIIQEQTKRAQAEEAESALALAKAQETARQAAMMKEQAERALRAAQAGMLQSVPPQNPQMEPYVGNVMPVNFYSNGPNNNFGASMSNPTQNNFAVTMPNSSAHLNRPYQMHGAPSGMMINRLQAPLIPVANPGNNPTMPMPRSNNSQMFIPAMPMSRSNTSQSTNNSAPTSNDPYAVFRSSDVNEPSIFTSHAAGIQNKTQPYSQSNMPYGQSPTFLPQSSTFVPGPYMNQQGLHPSQYGNMSQNHGPGDYANNGPQYMNNHIPNQSQMPSGNYQNSAGPNFMPPFNAGGNQGYNR